MPDSDSLSSRTLARLSFWVPPERLPEFEAAYASRLAPILKKHGLVESAEPGRPTAEGIFSRLFEVEGPAAIIQKREALLATRTGSGLCRTWILRWGFWAKGSSVASR